MATIANADAAERYVRMREVRLQAERSPEPFDVAVLVRRTKNLP
jgi:hypothetical protein